MDYSRHSIAKYTNDKKTQAAINNKTFKRLGHFNDQLYELKLAKQEIECIEPISLGFFILHYAAVNENVGAIVHFFKKLLQY